MAIIKSDIHSSKPIFHHLMKHKTPRISFNCPSSTFCNMTFKTTNTGSADMQKGGQLMPRFYRTFCILVHPQRVLVHSQTLCQTRNLSAGLGLPLLARNCVPNKSHMVTTNQSLFFFTKISKSTPTSQTFIP